MDRPPIVKQSKMECRYPRQMPLKFSLMNFGAEFGFVSEEAGFNRWPGEFQWAGISQSA
jgi:hypothetical protein